MKKFLLVLYLVLPFTAQAIDVNTQDASDTIRVDKLAKRDGRLARVNYSVDMPANSPGFETACCWIMGVYPEIKTLRDYIGRQLEAYEEIEPYDKQKFQKENAKRDGADLLLCYIKPKGEALGSLQRYSVEHTTRTNGEKIYFMLSIVYDKAKDKVLMVDDVFIPEIAAKIKSDFGEDFINIDISDFGIRCGYTSDGSGFDYGNHIYSYLKYESFLTNSFKQSIGFSELSKHFSQKEKEDVYDPMKVHAMPKFGLDDKGLKEFFDQNFHWPEELKRKQYKDAFTVKFIVERDGSISNVKIIIPDSTLVVSPIEQEMERVMKLLPPCSPGLFYDIPVRTATSIFFSFNQKSPSGIEYGAEAILKEAWRKAQREQQRFRERQYQLYRFDRLRGRYQLLR